MAEKIEPTHLGDGAYALYCGYAIELTTGSHDAGTLVMLEAAEFKALVRYGLRCFGDNVLPEEVRRRFGP